MSANSSPASSEASSQTTVSTNVTEDRVVMGLDSGGTLVKMVYINYLDDNRDITNFIEEIKIFAKQHSLIYEIITLLDTFYNKRVAINGFYFEKNGELKTTEQLVSSIKTHKDLLFGTNDKIVICGSGAEDMKRSLTRSCGVQVEVKQPEFLTMVGGLSIVNKIHKVNGDQFFEFTKTANGFEKVPLQKLDDTFMFVVVGTATSILHIDLTKLQYNYIQHLNISGGTFYGLCKLFANCQTFEEAIKAAESGVNYNNDFLFTDMMSPEVLAEFVQQMASVSSTSQDPDMNFLISSFGKCKVGSDAVRTNGQDFACSALKMVANACILNTLTVAKLKGCKQIVFSGSFFNESDYAKQIFASFVKYLTIGNPRQAIFTDNSSFITGLGCLHRFEKDPVTGESLM